MAVARSFLPSEDTTPVGAPVSVVTYEFWQNELGGEEIVGKPLRVWNVITTVVGITPPGFVGVFDANPPVGVHPDHDVCGEQSRRERSPRVLPPTTGGGWT